MYAPVGHLIIPYSRPKLSDLISIHCPRLNCLKTVSFTVAHTTKAYMYGLLTKFVQSRWLDIGQVLFLRVYGPRLSRGP